MLKNELLSASFYFADSILVVKRTGYLLLALYPGFLSFSIFHAENRVGHVDLVMYLDAIWEDCEDPKRGMDREKKEVRLHKAL